MAFRQALQMRQGFFCRKQYLGEFVQCIESVATPSSTSVTRQQHLRFLSSVVAQNLDLSVDQTSGIAVLKMMRQPVNSLNLEMLKEFNLVLDKLDNSSDIHGLILTSGVPKIFCAGLDILEMYKPKLDRLNEFWRTLQKFWIKLYGTRLATVAAINGQSPAGGCLVTLMCDHRIMADGKYIIGLNESLLGLAPPFWVMDTMRNVIGQRRSERALQLGTWFNPAEALTIGLVDEVVPEAEIADRARQEVTKWIKVPGVARELTKEAMRRPTIEKLSVRQEAAAKEFIELITKDSTQRIIASYLEKLNKKNK